MLEKTTALVCVALGAMLSTARADNDSDSESKPAAEVTAATADGADQLTLPKGRLLLAAFFEMNLSSGAVLKPFSISPDVWYGVTDDITVGLVHSAVGGSGFIGGVANSLCLAGESGGCADLYPGAGADVRYNLKKGMLAYAVDGGLYALHLSDPLLLSVKLGVAARWHSGPLAVELQPNVFVGVTNRTVAGVAGAPDITVNGDILSLPGTVLFNVAPKIDVAAQTGIVLPLENTSDAYFVPLSIGGFYHLNESLNVSLAFSLPRLIAASGGGADARSLTLGGTYAF
jgi:hypothetical protein